MQKVLQRSHQAQRQAIRKSSRRLQEKLAIKANEFRRATNEFRKAEAEDIKAARFNRREDYERGPLAPRRDVGDLVEAYGTIDSRLMRPPRVPLEDKIKYFPIRAGDRVVILKGRDQGKIGEVKSTHAKNNTIVVDGLNMVDIALPEWHLKHTKETNPIGSQERPLPMTDVALVYPLPDPMHNDAIRDVIIPTSNLEFTRRPLFSLSPSEIAALAESGRYNPPLQRRIQGTETVIPFKKQTREEPKDTDSDTLRIAVEERTFMPTLLRPPMPETVIDELRNKYSKFRTRHEPEYVARKEEEDRLAAERKEKWRTMMTPLQEWHAKQHRLRHAPLEELDKRERVEAYRLRTGAQEKLKESLARVGEFMARNGRELPPLVEEEVAEEEEDEGPRFVVPEADEGDLPQMEVPPSDKPSWQKDIDSRL